MREGRGWVGVVANAAAGLGRGRERVRRLVAELQGGGLETEVGWTPEARSALVERSRADRAGCSIMPAPLPVSFTTGL